MVENKSHKLFVSHSSKDKAYLEAFVDLLRVIGVPDSSVICTCIPGLGIPSGEKIFDWLKNQFNNCQLHVIFVLSHNYYESAACLNEMGATWVTKTTDTLILLPGFDFTDIKGCIDSSTIGIKLDLDEYELKNRLNELKKELISEFHLSDEIVRWEKYRDNFIEKVRHVSLQSASKKEKVFSNEKNIGTVTGKNSVGHVPVETAFLLVYAAEGDGQIIKIDNLGYPVQIIAGNNNFTQGRSKRESARWQEALDQLIEWGWVKQVGKNPELFELTDTGYNKAECLKDAMCINTDLNPLEEIKLFV